MAALHFAPKAAGPVRAMTEKGPGGLQQPRYAGSRAQPVAVVAADGDEMAV
jgi:hypothetical protein